MDSLPSSRIYTANIYHQTEVVGQDGISYAPILTTQQLRAIREQIAGWNGNPTDGECQTTLKGVGLFEWQTVGEYLDCLERNRTATNVAMLVPQGNLRLLACGPYDTPATKEEIQHQVKLLREAMDQGAVGMSRWVGGWGYDCFSPPFFGGHADLDSGLTYTPGMYASTSELAVLCRTLAEEYPGAYYAPHHRSYGFRAIESYAEMLGLAKDTGCPVREWFFFVMVLLLALANSSIQTSHTPPFSSAKTKARPQSCSP